MPRLRTVVRGACLALTVACAACTTASRAPGLAALTQQALVALAASVLVAAVIALWVSVNAFRPATQLGADPPACGTGPSMILSAQAVPSAAKLPCIAALPSGWTPGFIDIRNGHALFWLDSDLAGLRAVTITLTATCDTIGAVQVPSDQPGAERFERPLSLRPRFTLARIYINIQRAEELALCGRGARCPG